MLRGDVITDGWNSEEVKESLDLCLACKGCKGDCPVNVDIATYKAEFLAHYYRDNLAHGRRMAFGYIDVWAKVASKVPGLANLRPELRDLRPWPSGWRVSTRALTSPFRGS